MAKFRYLAKNLQGKTESGIVDCQNERELVDNLRRRGFFLVKSEYLNDAKNRSPILRAANFLQNLSHVPLSEKLFFTRNLAVMVKSGIALPRAFKILSAQTKNKPLKKILISLSEAVSKGSALSEALAAYEGSFPLIYRETIKVGEETGRLAECLEMLNVQMEREHSLKAKIKTAMIYPLVVCFMALLIGIFMFIFAVPKLKAAFKDFGVELPITTKAIFYLGDTLAAYWQIVLLVVFALFLLLFSFYKWKKTKRAKAFLSLRTPLLRRIIRQLNEVATLRTLSALLASGVPVVRALNLTSGALSNFYFKKNLEEAALLVEKGKKISEALNSRADIYSSMVIQMLEIGEETGETSEMLVMLADFYEAELTSILERVSSLVEPLLITGLGAAVGFFAVSVIQPMTSILSGIH